MGKRESTDTAESCESRNCNMVENEDPVLVPISKRKKLNGRSYKERVKSLVKAKESDPPLQEESFLPQVEFNVSGEKDSSGNETTDSNSSLARSTPEGVCFRLRRIRCSSHSTINYSPDHVTQNEKTKNNIIESQGNVDESKLLENASGEESKSTIIDFIEYWVPVKLSKLQIEQYCCSLSSNSVVLSSPYEYKRLRTLREILVSVKKCCDHPYLVDRSLHTCLMEGVPQSEQLDAQIKLSGKLLLLHKALLEINKRGLRALVLYQDQSLGGSETITTGDILDDIIHEKFGRDSFVRIDGQIFRYTRQAILDSFNDRRGGKFVCLMETHACAPSINLKSIDTVIIFNSDSDPMNDLKALQRINLDSQFERVKVFRLYSAYTVEEKVLMLPKQGTTPEGTRRNITHTNYHELLTWGAYFLFKKLDDFHDASASEEDSIAAQGNSFVENVLKELCVVLPNNDKSDVHTKNSLVLEAQQIRGVHSTNISLLAQVENTPMEDYSAIEEMLSKEPPYVFWMNILEGRKPRWKYNPCRSPTTRKIVQSLDDMLEAHVGNSKKSKTEAGNAAFQTPTIARRARNRRQSRDRERKLPGKAVAPRRTESMMVGEPLTTQRASSVMENMSARETSQVTLTEVLQSAREALHIELKNLKMQKAESLKRHKDMKQQTRMECEREIDQIQKKYEAMLQKADAAFLQEKESLDTRYKKVRINKELAESSMQTGSTNATLSQVTTRFIVEQAYQLISQKPTSNTVRAGEEVAEQEVEASPKLHSSEGIEAGSLRATAPHLRQQVEPSLPLTVLKKPSERPEIIYSPVTLQQQTS